MNKFIPRDYQIPIINALEGEYKKVLAILPRRSGKDLTAFNICVNKCLEKKCTIYYISLTLIQSRIVVWDLVDDYIPTEFIKSKSSEKMFIEFVNGSILQLGSYDSCINYPEANGVVFSEFYHKGSQVYKRLISKLKENDGWLLIISTPHGRNHLWKLYKKVLISPEWFVYKISINETKHISIPEIQRARYCGGISDEEIAQHFFCEFI